MNVAFFLEELAQDQLSVIALPIFLIAVLAEYWFAKKRTPRPLLWQRY